jgi:protease IV
VNYSQEKPRGFLSRLFGGLGSLITWTRNTLMNVIFILILIGVISAIYSNTPAPLPGKFALRIAPSGLLVDQRNYIDTASMLLDNEDEETETLVRDIVDSIDRAADDKRVTGIVLELGGLDGGGITKMEEIGAALLAFKTKKKNIIAVSDSYSQDQYYLASFADEIYLHPMGAVELTGFGRYITYYKSALEKLGVNMHVFRSGKYKDYVEPYLRDSMSDESREHNSQWLNQLWAQYTNRVEEQRKLPAGSLNTFVNNLDTKMIAAKGNSAQVALDEHLVDKLADRTTIDNLLIEKFGKNKDEDFYSGVGIHAYTAEAKLLNTQKENRVALLVASGTIVDGHKPEGSIGSESFLETLRDIKTDNKIKALVIRIDSGGGSAFASEIIRHEIEALRNNGMPVFISMGTVAASGGYWMATAGNEIWAMPTTITGSIGVFGAIPTLENSLQKIGVSTDGISTTELGGAVSLDRALSPKMASVIQTSVDHIYQDFIKLVADARKKEVTDINEIAQGHVWTGNKALEIGLVDHLGNLNDVIAAAAAYAKITDYSVQLITQKLSPKEELIRKLIGGDTKVSVRQALLEPFIDLSALKHLSPLLKPLSLLKTMTAEKGIYASCLECLAP